MLEIMIDNKDGNVWDVSELVSDVTWKTSRIGKPASVDFTLIKDGIFQCNNGDVVRIRLDEQNVFYGYVFVVDDGKDEDVRILAYDQTRYLMVNDTYVFKNVTATEVVEQICGDFGLKFGTLEDTLYKIPAMVEDNKKLIDTICKALALTLISTGRIYVLYDDFGELTIRNVEDMKLDFIIGDDSLMYDYSQKRSIDSDTYNQIKVVQDNKTSGHRDVYILFDSANIAKWGRLQLYQIADENMNAAQINEQLKQLIESKNREQKTLKLDVIGDIRVRAGCYISIYIEGLSLNQYFLIDECSHKVSGADHTMSLELRVI